uniref:Uncharacterized protein n=1 Tax=Periophthalmus magnuspinnatus TaxID=409849 RepID=A0A3B4B0E4_9GOBI
FLKLICKNRALKKIIRQHSEPKPLFVISIAPSHSGADSLLGVRIFNYITVPPLLSFLGVLSSRGQGSRGSQVDRGLIWAESMVGRAQ